MFSIYADGQSIYDPSVSSFYLFNPQVKLEFGKSGSLEFSIPPTNLYYNSLKQLKTLVSVDLDGEEIFRGRVFSIELDFNNFKKVYCEGDLSYLVDSVQKGEAYTGTTRALFNKIIAAHNSRVEDYKQFTVGNVTIEDRSIVLSGQSDENLNVGDIDYKQIAINSIADEWNNTFDCIQNWLIDYCGGYLRTRRVGSTTYIDYLESYTSQSAQRVSFGNNLLDLTGEANAEDVFTVLVPIGDENLTIESVNNGSDELVDDNAVSRYGRIVRTHVFSNVNNASTLLENARRYLAENVNLPVTYTVKAIDLHLLDDNTAAIHIGDRVRLESSPHGISENLTCTEIEYDLANPENNSYTFGNPKQTLTQRYKEDQRKQSDSSAAAAGSVGAASAGAAGAAAAAAAETQKQALKDELYEEWIDIDPDNPDGIGSLGGLYKLLKDGREVLTKQVGIDFNAEEGNINLHSLTQQLNETTGNMEAALAEVSSFTGTVDGELTAIQKMVAQVSDDTIHRAEWGLFATNTETAIRGKADSIEVETLRGELGGQIENEIGDLKDKLTQKVGIKWNTEQGSVDIFSINKKVNEQGTLILQNTANIQTKTDDLSASISLVAASAGKNGVKIGELSVKATQLGSEIKGIADKLTLKADKAELGGLTTLTKEVGDMKKTITKQVGINWDTGQGSLDLFTMSSAIDANTKAISNSSTRITQLSNDIIAMQTVEAQYGDNVAKIMATANANSSALLLKADKVTVNADFTTIRGRLDAAEANIRSLSADKITADQIIAAFSATQHVAAQKLTASSIYSPNIYVGSDDGSYPVATQNFVTTTVNSIGSISPITGSILGMHYHAMSENVAAGTVTLGAPTSIGPQTFDIRATQTYIRGVAAAQEAANITNITIDSSEQDTSVSYNETTKIISFYRSAEAYKNSTPVFNKDPIRVTVSGAKAYSHGLRVGAENQQNAIDEAVNAIKISELGRDNSRSVTTTQSGNHYYVSIPIKAKASNGADSNTDLSDQPRVVSADVIDVYTAGRQSVDITSIAKETVGGTTEMYNNDHTTTVYVIASANNNETFSGTVKTGTTAYDKGYAAGRTKGQTEGKDAVTIDSLARQNGKADTYDAVSHTASIYVAAKTSNGKTKLATFTTNTTAYDTGYTTGKTDGEKGVTVDKIARRSDITNEKYDSSTHKTTIYVVATASNGSTKNSSFVTGTAAYDDGLTKGGESVTIDSITQSVVGNSFKLADRTIDYKITATASNGKTKTETKSLNVGQAISGIKIDSLTYSISSQDYDKHTIVANLKAEASNGSTKEVNWTIGTTGHYNQGKTDYNPTTLNISAAAASNDSSSEDYGKYNITATATNAAGSQLITKTVKTSTTLFNRGKNMYNPTSIAISAVPASDDSSTTDYRKYKIVATAKNSSGTILYTAPATTTTTVVYNRGMNDYKSRTLDIKSVTYQDPATSGKTPGNYVLTLRSTANAEVKTGEVNLLPLAAWDEGRRGVTLNAIGANTYSSPSQGSTAYGGYDNWGTYYEYYVSVPLTVSASNGQSQSNNVIVSIDSTYWSGYRDGQDSVSCPYITDCYISSYRTGGEVKVVVTFSDGTWWQSDWIS